MWANTTPQFKALASDSLECLTAHGVVRADFIRPLLTQRLPERPDYFGEMTWILTMLENWLQRHARTLKGYLHSIGPVCFV